jgi:large subunit ribosomal protein L22
MPYSASHRFARIAATKVRPFVTLIRGKPAAVSLDLLRYVPNRGARMLEKVLKSAMANAENQGARNVDRMIVTDARANNGPMFKRMQPRARGMSYLILRRFAHIDVSIDAPAVAIKADKPAAGDGTPAKARKAK